MEKLNYIASYLPYGIIGVYRLGNVVIDINERYANEERIKKLTTESVDFFYKFCKPILHPLSDLTKEIEHNGEKFVPIEYFEIGEDDNGIEYDFGNIKTINLLESISKNNCWHDIHYMPFSLVQKLLEWHFDIHGLIEKRLAIDINTINHQSTL